MQLNLLMISSPFELSTGKIIKYKSFWTENGKFARYTRVRVLHEGALYALKYGTWTWLN